ncbi:DNA excision repair protein ERCC-5 [Angomonas deanei]|uniref:XPG N-terminal domain/XPG domain containing/XPG I-region, putative n=1 Tax=Angomonas deanei TaxID=59799 RepID=A0A7G2CER6_9TRYP|nr:DNA excision repair protein ERCC-5 [Angomonas deanei]CAD2216672.1 XPG N-terminal domain/XPG domain containing/XPG I-region, putative [Angomonas deanei]|eukprot:EPY35135.1 DNA excision repair protein ERCC-5 [Angomonas deanei]
MGVHGLWRLLDTFGEVSRPEDWKGKKVAIDASIWMAQFRAQKGANGETSETVILEGFLNRILKLLFYEIEAVFVFDGAAGSSKQAEHKRRAAAREALYQAQVRRKAREIVSAQVASGALSLHDLEKVEGTPQPQAETAPADHKTELPAKKEKLPGNYTNYIPVAKKRRRVVAPNRISASSTLNFLEDAKEFLMERKKGEDKVKYNTLKDTTTSLFLGPRFAVDEGAKVKRIKNETSVDEEDREVIDADDSSDSDGSSCVAVEDVDDESVVTVTDSHSAYEVDSSSESVPSLLLSQGEEEGWPLSDVGSEEETEPTQLGFTPWNPGTQLMHPARPNLSQSSDEFAPVQIKKVPPHPVKGTYTAPQPVRPSKEQPVPFELVNIIELIQCCGMSYIVSPSESDSQCAFLNTNGLVDAVFTEDSDVVVHGAPVVLRGFFSASRQVVRYNLHELRVCGLTKTVFVSLAHLLGCDYTEGVPGIGVIGALAAIAAAWPPKLERPEVEAECVMDLLARWSALAKNPPSSFATADEQMTVLQWTIASHHANAWSALLIPKTFPDRDVVEAFYFPKVDTDPSSFTASSPDFEAIRMFAGSRGLLGAHWMRQRLDIVRQAYAAGEKGVQPTDQKTLDEFGLTTRVREKWIYKKQSPKYAKALENLRQCMSD